ncbi:hypothetical protein [Agrobacterium pusense]|uniref:hypothetical protein n=1 Tax=Agrobacterium pusense TaxID=648995 RepID=UPI003FCF3F61
MSISFQALFQSSEQQRAKRNPIMPQIPSPRAAVVIAALATAVPAAGEARATGSEPVAEFSTEFENQQVLTDWSEHNVSGWAPKWQPPRIENGHLVLQPRSSGWFDDNHAGHLYRTVTGDFIVSTRVKAEGTQSAYPKTDFSLAGLFIRAPRDLPAASNWTPGKENWLFFSVGTAEPAGEPHYEIKSTINSRSVLKILQAQEGWVELRIARTGELFTLLHRPEGVHDWTVLDQMIRPDLPETLNVGLTAYSDWTSIARSPNYNVDGAVEQHADFIARVDYIRFRRPASSDRLPIANLDAPQAGPLGPMIKARRDDLLSN